MAKWFGKVGYEITDNIKSGVWEPQITERPYFGDMLSDVSKRNSTNKVNDDLNVANRISIISDPFANQHFSQIKYVEIMGTLWEVSMVEVQYPRLILTVGGVYNGK